MKQSLKVSHSSKQKYSHCPKLYYLHYIEKIRPTETTSALLFGTAIDKACESYALESTANLAKDIFKNEWKKVHDLPEDKQLNYYNNDFDAELLTQSDNEFIIKDTVYETVSDLVKDGKEKERIDYARWLSLYYKGLLMVESFISWFDENVEECLAAQLPIELEDGDGNILGGLADFIIKIRGYDKPVLVDLKTSARPYMRGSVKESEQLALYYFYLKNSKFPDIERAAYLVLNKQIKKNRVKTCKICGEKTEGREKTCAVGDKKNRCNGDFLVDITPECVVQYIHDEIPEEFIEQTIQKFNVFIDDLKTEKFEENWEGCESYYGRRCPYFEYCRNGNMEGLCKKENKNVEETTETNS